MAKLCVNGLLWLAAPAMAQSAFTACDVDPSVAPVLGKAIAASNDPQLAFADRIAPFLALLDRYPTDPFVNRAFLARLGGYNILPLYDRQLPRFESLYRAHPDDPAARYLLALSTKRRDPKNSTVVFEQLTQSPWPLLALGRLREFAEMCPNTLDLGALQAIAAGNDEALKRQTSERLRKQLAGRADWQALQAWPVLWEMEFQITPAAGHERLRARVRQDVAALREIRSDMPDRKLDIMRRGCTLANDMETRRQIAAEVMRVAPQSAAAADAAIEQWEERNPYPDRSAPVAELDAYRVKQWAADKDWIDRWPNYGPAWTPAYAAFRMDNQDKDTIDALGRRLAAFLQRNPDYTLGFTDQETLPLAQHLTAKGVDLDLVPELLARAGKQIAERLRSDQAAAVRPMSETEIARNFKSQSWLILRTQAMLQARKGDGEGSRASLENLLRQTDTAAGDTLLAWLGIIAAADAALLTESPGVARDAITRMSATLAGEADTTPVEKRNHAVHESEYWQSRARLSALEGRNADAVAYYVRAANATPRNFNPTGRSILIGEAEKAWSKLGGTADGWLAYNPDAAPGQADAQWRDVSREMPGFSLEDSTGLPVRLADWNGKTVFINVWATWCGPCQGELPWVQRLYDTLKDKPGVTVLTFNVDENPGVIAQYMREHGFNFPVVLARDFIDTIMKVDAIPRNWIVDARGMLRFERQAGFDETFVNDTIEAIARAR